MGALDENPEPPIGFFSAIFASAAIQFFQLCLDHCLKLGMGLRGNIGKDHSYTPTFWHLVRYGPAKYPMILWRFLLGSQNPF